MIYSYCIPDEYHSSIQAIDYEALKKQGKTSLLFDLDNTIIDYHMTKLGMDMIEFLQTLEKDFKVMIISNSRYKRVFGAIGNHFEFVAFARKPFKVGFKKALKKLNSKPTDSVMIGDQLMTDCFGAKRLGLYTILVDAVARKTDKIWTKTNRMIEKHMLNVIKKKAPQKYEEVLKRYAEKYV